MTQIGAATVRAFVARGVTKIALADLQKDKLEDMAAELVKGNPQIEVATFVCDVSKEEDVASMVEGAAKKVSPEAKERGELRGGRGVEGR